MTKIKICGITNYEDALACIALEIEYIGFNFYQKSPRYIAPEAAKEIIGRLPDSGAKFTGVFVNEDFSRLSGIVNFLGLGLVQIHGDENSKYTQTLKKNLPKIKVIKVIRVKDKTSLAIISTFNSDYLLFDTYAEDMYGGTGNSFDYNIIKTKKKFFLAGGINQNNILKALGQKPYAVDINSGVEITRGKKDLRKIHEIVTVIRNEAKY